MKVDEEVVSAPDTLSRLANKREYRTTKRHIERRTIEILRPTLVQGCFGEGVYCTVYPEGVIGHSGQELLDTYGRMQITGVFWLLYGRGGLVCCISATFSSTQAYH